MQFSLRFKQICKDHGVTQKKALADMGFHRNAVQSWGNGKPSMEALLKIAEYFDLSTDEVIGVENKKKPTPQEGERDYSMIMEAFEKADSSTREAILLLLKLK